MAAPPRSPTFTEFIVFRLKPSVKPEEGESNREGEQLLDLFRETMLQSGHLGSAWGRALEDENVVIWVIGSPPHSFLRLEVLTQATPRPSHASTLSSIT